MLFNYDSWNRMQSDKFSATGDSLNLPDAIGCPLDILHPDGEVVSYGYDCRGNLDFMKGQKGSETFSYVSALLYNEYGQRMKAEYGNGTSAKYTYDNLQHLSHLTTFDAQGNTMQDIDYTFDAVSNITMVDNAAPAPETDLYFYHPDHLGSASWITDAQGSPIQHLQYNCSPLREIHCISLTLSDVHRTSFTYGEPFVNQHTSNYMERFTFTGKERDEETGYGYFGARYMDHELMTMWLSVDPMADKYPSLSPYNYCAWNPVKLVDPDGMEAWKPDSAGNLIAEKLDNAQTLATYLNTTPNIAIRMLEEQGYSATPKGESNVKEGDVFIIDYGKESHSLNKDLGRTGNFIRQKANSGIAKDLFTNYWQGGGDVTLSGSQFAGILMFIKNSKQSPKKSDGNHKSINFYNSNEYALAFGTASIKVDCKQRIIGFSDTYDFDPKKGQRTLKNELKTRAVYAASKISGNGKSFTVSYR